MAGASFRGDFAKLRTLTEGLSRLSSTDFKRRCNERMAAEAMSRVLEGFNLAQDPSGKPWKPVLKRKRGAPPYRPLRDTGRLLNSIRPRSSSAGFWLSTPVIYAATHQWGRDAIPQRQFLPTSRLPAKWARAFARILADERDRALGRK